MIMKKMPVELKKLLRKKHMLNTESKEIGYKISELLEKYGIPEDALRADSDYEVSTEALTYIDYAEGLPEDNIDAIEEVFLYYVNKK
jgi:hypothetical protein